jgi:hypothetical protein
MSAGKPPPRTLESVKDEAAATLRSAWPLGTASGEYQTLARALVQVAYDLGQAEGLLEYRKALGQAWGAFLGAITDEMWDDIFIMRPDLRERLLHALHAYPGGGGGAHVVVAGSGGAGATGGGGGGRG